jgi:hypothetical protein
MLFTATSINYMDRQVIAILKPTLEHSIGLTEAEYGYIVDAFSARLRNWPSDRGANDRQAGHAHRLHAGDGGMESLGDGACLGQYSARNSAIARFTLGLGEAGNFPAAIKTVAEWFPKSERSLATGILKLRSERRSDSGSAHRAVGDGALWLAHGLRDYRNRRRVLDSLVVSAISQADRSSHAHG